MVWFGLLLLVNFEVNDEKHIFGRKALRMRRRKVSLPVT